MKIGIIAELLLLPLHEAIKRCAQLGAEGIQLHALHKDHNLLEFTPEQIRALKDFVKEQNLVISAICGDLPGHGFSRPAENPAKVIRAKQIIDLLPALDCKVTTMHIGVIPEEANHPIYEPMVLALRELGDHAHQQGLSIAIETGPERAIVLKRFIEDTASKGVGVNFDPANLIMVMNDDPLEGVRLLGSHIVHTHAKDGVHHQFCDPARVYGAFAEGGFDKLIEETGELFTEVPLGTGSVLWPQYLEALHKVGYNGFLTIERETGADPAADITMAVNFLKQQLKAIA